jgi:hypothetical protein
MGLSNMMILTFISMLQIKPVDTGSKTLTLSLTQVVRERLISSIRVIN